MIKIFCFLASYALALCLELWHHFRPHPTVRRLAQLAAAAGFVAHTLYLADKGPPLKWLTGSALLLSWVLAIFYLFGSLHYQRFAWGIFVLPLVLGLVILGAAGKQLYPQDEAQGSHYLLENFVSLPAAHGVLLLLAAVGLCVGFVASLMYLYQARLLRSKQTVHRPHTLSLERLEMMNRRAIVVSFPLLSAGILLGVGLMFTEQLRSWYDPRVVSTFVLWPTFGLLVYLRFGAHLAGRSIAVWTIVTFGLLVGCLILPHLTVGQGGAR
jgi:ABC-type transport system involved in cytochrome c biogenesis permease subunit